MDSKGSNYSRHAQQTYAAFLNSVGVLIRVPLAQGLSKRRQLPKLHRNGARNALRIVMTVSPGVHRMPVVPRTSDDSRIRPRSEKIFSVPYDDLVIRAWRPTDRDACAQLIANVLAEYELNWEPESADRDVIEVETSYKDGEFWVIEEVKTSEIVGTAAYLPIPDREDGAVELRKIYLKKSVRGNGLGSFLLLALEQRAFQLGYRKSIVETASVLQEAAGLYKKHGYVECDGVEVERCDMALEKELLPLEPCPIEEHVEIIDMSRAWTVTRVTRKTALTHRLFFRAIAVLVESNGRIYVHKRSMKKSTYPGRMAVLVTGCVDWMEDTIEAAKREVQEELGLSGLEFTRPFAPFTAKGKDDLGQRIEFHPFIARGNFTEEDVVCDPEEVESGEFMTRPQIIERGIGGTLWSEFRNRGL